MSMAAISSEVARSLLSWITETRYCISDQLLWSGPPLVGGRSPLPRTPLPRSDTAARISVEPRCADERDPTASSGRLSSGTGTTVAATTHRPKDAPHGHTYGERRRSAGGSGGLQDCASGPSA